MVHSRKITVIGLGYVGLPVVVAFARSGATVIGFDIDPLRIEELQSDHDKTREVEPAELRQPTLRFEKNPSRLVETDFFIVADPTPIDSARKPNPSPMLRASETVAGVLKRGDIVVYESTVYPGAVEEDCIPILQNKSRFFAGRDFAVGYSPERVNPGDKMHRFEAITKVASA